MDGDDRIPVNREAAPTDQAHRSTESSSRREAGVLDQILQKPVIRRASCLSDDFVGFNIDGLKANMDAEQIIPIWACIMIAIHNDRLVGKTFGDRAEDGIDLSFRLWLGETPAIANEDSAAPPIFEEDPHVEMMPTRLLALPPTVDDRGELDLDAKDCRIKKHVERGRILRQALEMVDFGDAVRGPRRESGRNTTGHLTTRQRVSIPGIRPDPENLRDLESRLLAGRPTDELLLEEDIVAFEDTLAEKLAAAGSQCSAVVMGRSLGGVTGRL